MESNSAQENEKISEICYNTNEPWGHYAKWNKPGTERQILYDSALMSFLEVVKLTKKVEW